MLKKLVTIIVVFGLAALAYGAVMAARSSGGDTGTNVPLFTAAKGPLVISVSEAGTIQARDRVIIKSEVEGQTTIINLIDEGARVKKGDLLVELDSSALEDKRLDQAIRMQNAEAAWIRSRENLEVVKSQTQSDISAAELGFEFAKEDLTHYVEGSYPNQLDAAESKIQLAGEELKRAEDKLNWSEKLFEEKYISQTELEADRLTRNRAQLNNKLATQERDLLTNFTYKRNLTELKSNIEQAEMKLDRVKRKAKADIIQAEADLKAKEAEHVQQQGKLEKIIDQISKTKIFAPINGMVVYATSATFSWRGNTEPLDEGQQVRERQELIHLPTADSMKVEIKVHESSLDKVALNQPVRVTVDALPGKVYIGRVGRIAPLPDATSVWLNPDLKVFSTDVYLDENTEGLRPGMSCRAEIVVDEMEDVLFVPVQSVVRIDNEPVVFVRRGSQDEPQRVKIGLDNSRMVHVVDGLEPGDQVLMAPPLTGISLDPVVGESVAKTNTDDEAKSTPVKAAPKESAATQEEVAAVQSREPRGEMTEAQRAERRKRFENMTDEQREEFRRRRQQQQESSP